MQDRKRGGCTTRRRPAACSPRSTSSRKRRRSTRSTESVRSRSATTRRRNTARSARATSKRRRSSSTPATRRASTSSTPSRVRRRRLLANYLLFGRPMTLFYRIGIANKDSLIQFYWLNGVKYISFVENRRIQTNNNTYMPWVYFYNSYGRQAESKFASGKDVKK